MYGFHPLIAIATQFLSFLAKLLAHALFIKGMISVATNLPGKLIFSFFCTNVFFSRFIAILKEPFYRFILLNLRPAIGLFHMEPLCRSHNDPQESSRTSETVLGVNLNGHQVAKRETYHHHMGRFPIHLAFSRHLRVFLM